MTADLAGEVTSAAGPVQLSDLQRILSAIQPSGISEKSCPFGYVLLLDLLLKLTSLLLAIPDVMADPDAGKCHSESMHFCL